MENTLYLNDENLTKIIEKIDETIAPKITSELQIIGEKQLFEKNLDFFAEFILAKSNSSYWLVLFANDTGWKQDFTKKIMEKLEEKNLPENVESEIEKNCLDSKTTEMK